METFIPYFKEPPVRLGRFELTDSSIKSGILYQLSYRHSLSAKPLADTLPFPPKRLFSFSRAGIFLVFHFLVCSDLFQIRK